MIRENIYWLEDLVQMSSLNFYCCFEIITIIALSGALQMLCSVCFKGKPKSNFNKMSIFFFFKNYAAKEKYTLPEESFLCLLDFDVLKKDPAWIE